MNKCWTNPEPIQNINWSDWLRIHSRLVQAWMNHIASGLLQRMYFACRVLTSLQVKRGTLVEVGAFNPPPLCVHTLTQLCLFEHPFRHANLDELATPLFPQAPPPPVSIVDISSRTLPSKFLVHNSKWAHLQMTYRCHLRWATCRFLKSESEFSWNAKLFSSLNFDEVTNRQKAMHLSPLCIHTAGFPPSGKIRESKGTFFSFWKVREFQYYLSRVRENDLAEATQSWSLISRHILVTTQWLPVQNFPSLCSGFHLILIRSVSWGQCSY